MRLGLSFPEKLRGGCKAVNAEMSRPGLKDGAFPGISGAKLMPLTGTGRSALLGAKKHNE
jgi:hypothetical protein